MTDVPPEPDRIPIRENVTKLFRAEAIEHYQQGRTEQANLLELESRRWMRYAALLVVALVLTALAFGWWWVRRG